MIIIPQEEVCCAFSPVKHFKPLVSWGFHGVLFLFLFLIFASFLKSIPLAQLASGFYPKETVATWVYLIAVLEHFHFSHVSRETCYIIKGWCRCTWLVIYLEASHLLPRIEGSSVSDNTLIILCNYTFFSFRVSFKDTIGKLFWNALSWVCRFLLWVGSIPTLKQR